MSLKDEILKFLEANNGTRSINIWDELNKNKKERWLKAGGLRGWLAKRNSVWAEVSLGQIYVSLERLIDEGRIKRRRTIEASRPIHRYYSTDYS